uniref:Uncharacterized protein n=1 Tax=viral metagenome TaxID=1070528 RepID=A0A6C0HBZ1_9ZZZZ
MPLIKTKTKKVIGPIIDPQLENELDNETIDTQLNMLKQLNQRNKLTKTTLAKYNYLDELSRQRNTTWKDVKSPRTQKKRIRFGEDNVKEFFKDVPTILVPPKLKRTHTYGGKRNTRKMRKQRK